MKRPIAMLLILFLILPMTAQCGGVLGGGGASGGGGGGGSRQTSVDSLLKTIDDAKKRNDPKLEELKTLLWKDPITKEDYVLPTVLMYYKANNTTVSRNQPVEITTIITNNNAPETRRMLDLYLDVKNPNSGEYVRINRWPNKIQANEYDEKNTTYRVWGDIPSFAYLKTTGEVRLRVNASDGVSKWSTADYENIKPPFYSELVFNVTNNPPMMKNSTVTSGLVRHNDPIEYISTIDDADGDMLNVTLHIFDEKGEIELRNVTQQIRSGEPIRFLANEYKFFAESDGGKNFTYNYSFDDGISRERTELQYGPTLRRGPKLAVDRLTFSAESENYFWWQWYTFSARVKNLNPEEFNVTFTLYTSTKDEPGKVIGKGKTLRVGPQDQTVSFTEVRPFTVANADQAFSYGIKFSELEVGGKDFIENPGVRINAKIVPYEIYNPIILMNLFLMLLLVAGIGILVERNLKRGVEDQESSSSGARRKNGDGSKRGGGISGIAGKVSGLFKRGG